MGEGQQTSARSLNVDLADGVPVDDFAENRRHIDLESSDLAELIADLVQGARPPALARRLRIFELRVAALNKTALYDTVKRRTIVEPGTSELYELLCVLDCIGWKKLKPNDALIGCDNGIELSCLFG